MKINISPKNGIFKALSSFIVEVANKPKGNPYAHTDKYPNVVFLNTNMKTTMKFQTSNPYNNIEINSTVPKFKVISPITLPNDIIDNRLIIIKLETPTGSIAVGKVESALFETWPDNAIEPINIYRKKNMPRPINTRK